MADENWRDLAYSSREALAYLGYRIGPDCLPDEEHPCEATYRQHAVAHLATIRAVVDHHLLHCEPVEAAEIFADVYSRVTNQMYGCGLATNQVHDADTGH